jgi:hypothetical protein
MTLATVSARLATIQATITGVTKAFDVFDDAPNALKDTYLPCFISVPGPSVYEGYGGSWVDETRIWRMMLFVTPIQRPSDVAKKAALVAPLFRATLTKFADAQQLNDLGGIDLAWISADDGLDVLEYAGELYAGIEFQLQVKEAYALTMST